MADKSHEKEEESAPPIGRQGSSTRGGVLPGGSTNKAGDLPDAPKKRNKGSSSGRGITASIATVVRTLSGRSPPQDASHESLRKHPDALKREVSASEEGSATKRHSETGEESAVINSPPGDSCLNPGDDLVVLDGHKEQLIKLLLEDNSGTTDVLVQGGSGLGATAVVRKVCEDVRMTELFDTIAWISVPRRHDSELIHEEILLQLLFKSTPFHGDFFADGLVDEDVGFSSKFKGRRCLIVADNLDDQRAQKALNDVSFSAETYRVIFISRPNIDQWNSPLNQDGRQLEPYKLEDLSVEQPWAHFHIKKSPEGYFPSPLKEVCQLIVQEFERLPAAIVLHLRNRKERNDEWAPMILPSDFPSFSLIRQAMRILHSDHRRFCLLLLSFFPKNTPISCSDVSRLWVAGRFLADLGEAKGFFKDLLDRKCIHREDERSDGELSTFRVDNLVHGIINSLSNQWKLVEVPSKGNAHRSESERYLYVPGSIMDLKTGKTFQPLLLFGLDVSSSEDKTTTSRALPLETSETPFSLLTPKVLDLTGAPFQIIPNEMFELTSVRYLSLRNTSIRVIPGSIEKLRHLEFLNAKQSYVTELPKEAEGLEGIRHILIYNYKRDPLTESYNLIGFKASCSIRGFKCLKKLCFVESDINLLKDLENLTGLRRLGIIKLRAAHCKLLCSSLQKLEMLKSLNIHAYDEDEILDLDDLSSSPPEFLSHLYLHGRLEKLPNWISSLSRLKKIILRWSKLEKALVETLGLLPYLVELQLRRAYAGKQLEFKDGQFPELKILLLDELEGLVSMSLERGTLPLLEELTVSRCPWLEEIPSGIEHLLKIRKLNFFDMSNEFYDKVQADHEKDGYEVFKAIPEVYLTRWRAGHWESTDEAHVPHQVKKTEEPPLFASGGKH